jgi:hypothetical protein
VTAAAGDCTAKILVIGAAQTGGYRMRARRRAIGARGRVAGAGLAQIRTGNKKAQRVLGLMSLIHKDNSGRGERIRTSGLYVPNVALYQAKLHPDLVLLDSYGVSVSFKTVLPSSKNIILAGYL